MKQIRTIIIAAVIFITAAIGGREMFVSAKKQIMIREQEILSEYTDDGILENLEQANRYLDYVQNYLEENQKELRIREIERNSDSVVIDFFPVGSYTVMPPVRAMK